MESIHYIRQQWSEYLLGKTEVGVQGAMEDHLYGCEVCLSLYLELVDQQETMQLSAEFTDQVMERLALAGNEISVGIESISSKIDVASRRPKLWLHYTVAASITLILVSSGLFQQLFAQSAHMSNVISKPKREAVTDRLINKAFALLDQMPTKVKIKGESIQ